MLGVYISHVLIFFKRQMFFKQQMLKLKKFGCVTHNTTNDPIRWDGLVIWIGYAKQMIKSGSVA